MRSIPIFLILAAVTTSGCAEHLDQLSALNRTTCANSQSVDCTGSADDPNRTYRSGQQRLNDQLNRQIN
jgi:hypothetical protein